MVIENNQLMTLLFFEPSSGFGGSGNSLFNLLKHLDKNKFKPIVVTFNEGPQFEKIKNLGIEIIKLKVKKEETEDKEGRLSYFKFIWDLLFNILPLSIKLVSIIKRYNIDSVHINTNIISGIPAILSARILGIPCICHIRQTRRFIKRERFFAKLVDRFIFINHKSKELNSDFIRGEKAKVIYDGINLEYFKEDNRERIRKEFNLDSYPIVGVVGRIVEGKGFDDFIRASAIVSQRRPEVKFLIVGADHSEGKGLEKELRNLSRNLNLNDKVIFTGWRNDTTDLISAFDINVQPYTLPEGLPNVIIEAMALSKPVIATNIPGPSEIVLDGETGLLVPPCNPQALAEVIIKLLDNSTLAKKMGEAGRKRVEEVFEIKKTVRKIEEIYEEISPHITPARCNMGGRV
ncbi:MAG: glycosyltransferase [Candidatus Omnitrophica bacterium]|nr:glycosyltransferase [Candidatus Omnitrophota bacterium]